MGYLAFYEYEEARPTGVRSRVEIVLEISLPPKHELVNTLRDLHFGAALVPEGIPAMYPELFPAALAGIRWLVPHGEIESIRPDLLTTDFSRSLAIRANFRLEAAPPLFVERVTAKAATSKPKKRKRK